MSSFRRPRKVKIKSREWKIQYRRKTHPSLRAGPGPDDWLLGSCEAPQHLITICLDQDEESMRDTLVHEICHAYYSSLPSVNHECDEAEENFVLAATEVFFEITRNSRNRWWIK